MIPSFSPYQHEFMPVAACVPSTLDWRAPSDSSARVWLEELDQSLAELSKKIEIWGSSCKPPIRRSHWTPH
jgi:hypothetical protein